MVIKCGRVDKRVVTGRYELRCSKIDVRTAFAYTQYEQAIVCLSNREIGDASRGTFHCKMANNRLITVFPL